MRDDIKDYNEVENLGRKFIEAVETGNAEVVKPYFSDDAVFYGSLKDTEPMSGSINLFYDVLKSAGPVDGNYIARVDVIFLEKNIATVRVIEDNWHGYKFTDLLVAHKINGVWKIVVKIFDTLSYSEK